MTAYLKLNLKILLHIGLNVINYRPTVHQISFVLNLISVIYRFSFKIRRFCITYC